MKNRKFLIILPVTMLLISSRMAASPADAIRDIHFYSLTINYQTVIM